MWGAIDMLPAAMSTYRPDVVITVVPTSRFSPIVRNVNHLGLRFDDLEHRSADGVAPCVHHVEAVLNIVREGQAKRLLICCTAGLSRSPALSIAAAVADGRNPLAVCQAMRSAFGHLQPNRLLLQDASALLGIDVLSPALQAFRYDRGRGRPTGNRVGLVELKLNAENVR